MLRTNIQGIKCAEYEARVQSRVMSLVRGQPDARLRNILPEMRGAAPEIVHKFSSDLVEPASMYASPHFSLTDRFEPHPLDFDWRFTHETAARLADLARRQSKTILLMGVPTVYELLKGEGINTILFDRNPAIEGAIPVDFKETNKPVDVPTSIQDATIVIDAPWYVDDLLAWIEFAGRHFHNINSMFISLWPELVRDTGTAERDLILDFLDEYGRVALLREHVVYEVPLFERLAYRERGIELDFSWRRGDLVIFQPRKPFIGITVEPPKCVTTWHRFLIGSRQIALRKACDTMAPNSIVHANKGIWHFDNVSRRDPRRESVQFWTSNNTAGDVFETEILVSALTKFFGMCSPLEELSIAQQKMLRELLCVADLELDNRQAFLKWQHFE